MIEYELLYLVPESKEGELVAIREKVGKMVTSQGGTFLAAETTEKRKMAYPIKKESRGIYIARRFTLPDRDEQGEDEESKTGGVLRAMNRELGLSPDILRSLLVRADDLPELKPIERVEKRESSHRGGRYEKRGALRPMPQAPVATPEVAKEISKEELDEQLKKKLDI